MIVFHNLLFFPPQVLYSRPKKKKCLNSYYTLKLICLASSLASLSAWLEPLPDVSGKRAVFMDVPHISQQKSCDLATK